MLTGNGRPTRRRLDASWVLIAYVLSVFLIPANLTVAAFGASGSPATLLGIVCLLWWSGAQLSKATATLTPPQPIRRAMLVFIIAILISYVEATTRPIGSIELNGADRGLILIASWLGVVLLTADGLWDATRIKMLLRTMVNCGGIVAVIGLAQYATGAVIIDVIQIPGLSPNGEFHAVYERAGLVRAAGTATHPIEFAVVLAMLLPLALHLALTDKPRPWIARWLPVIFIGSALPITISRSAVIAVVVALLLVIPTWTLRQRRFSYVLIPLGFTAVYVVLPGILGALTALFTGFEEDSSVASRTGSWELAFGFVARAPFFGRGFGTFQPAYRILDNQFLGLLIETGIIGLLATVLLFATAIVTGVRARRRSQDPTMRSLIQAVIAMVAAGACSLATFDAFGFPQVASTLMLGIGILAALHNLLIRPSLPGVPIQRPLPTLTR
jgi:O-antigen ligase